jgi:hypothetical protein
VYETHRCPVEQTVAAMQDGLALWSEEEREAVEPLLPRFFSACARLYDVVLGRRPEFRSSQRAVQADFNESARCRALAAYCLLPTAWRQILTI